MAESRTSLAGQVVVVMGGSAGIGLETARLAREDGARVVITGRDRERLEKAAVEVGAESALTLDLDDSADVERVFGELPEQLDHILVVGAVRSTRRWPSSTWSGRSGSSISIWSARCGSRGCASAGFVRVVR